MNDPTPERLVQDQRLRDALMRITTTPALWDQNTWLTQNECGTAGCLAGWLTHDADIVTLEGCREVVYMERAEALGLSLYAASEEYGLSYSQAGAELAGLPLHEAETLFSGGNTLAQLWELTAEFTDGRVKLPPELSERVREIDAGKQAEKGLL